MAEVAEACKAAGSSSVELHEMDASSKESVAALASAVEGKVSVLVNNAGTLTGLGVPPFENDPDDWDTMLAVNLAAPMRLVRLLGPSMAEKGNGVIINISSVAGLDPKPLMLGYATSKWGLTGFSESIAEALKGKIRVMTIFPAMVVTELTTGMLHRLHPEEMITTQDIMQATLLPFRMSSKACPTRIVIQNTTKAQRCLQRTALKRPMQPAVVEELLQDREASAPPAELHFPFHSSLMSRLKALALLVLVIYSLPVSQVSQVLAATAVVRDYLRLQRSERTAQF